MRLIDADDFEVVVIKDKSGSFADGVQWILEQIDNAPTVNQWIPVTESLPERSGWYLVSDNSGTWFGHYDATDGRWYGVSGMLLATKLTMAGIDAWMPLPAPYQGGE